MGFMQRAIVAMAMGAALARPAAAQVVFDGGAPTGLGGSSMNAIVTAQGFSLSGTSTFNTVRFWGFGDPPFTGTFTWTLYNRSGTDFGSQIASGIAAPTVQLSALNTNGTYQYDFGVGTRTLGTGDYFVEFSGAGTTIRWAWTSPNDAPMVLRSTSSGQQLTSANDVAFQLRMVTVPEPSSFVLVAAGVVLVGVQATRRRRRLASR